MFLLVKEALVAGRGSGVVLLRRLHHCNYLLHAFGRTVTLPMTWDSLLSRCVCPTGPGFSAAGTETK